MELNTLSIIITAVATAILALLTAINVLITKSILRAAKESNDPIVFIDIEARDYETVFILGNNGPGPAHDINFNLDNNIPFKETEYIKKIEELPIIINGLSYLAPNRILKFEFGIINWDDLDHQHHITIHINYKNNASRDISKVYKIYLNSYKGILFSSFSSPSSEIVHSLDRLRDTLNPRSPLDNLFKPAKIECPYCCERINKNAIKCPHCLEYINKKDE